MKANVFFLYLCCSYYKFRHVAGFVVEYIFCSAHVKCVAFFSFAILILCYCRAHSLSTTFALVALTICKLHICLKAFIAALLFCSVKCVCFLFYSILRPTDCQSLENLHYRNDQRDRGELYARELNREPNENFKKKN